MPNHKLSKNVCVENIRSVVQLRVSTQWNLRYQHTRFVNRRRSNKQNYEPYVSEWAVDHEPTLMAPRSMKLLKY